MKPVSVLVLTFNEEKNLPVCLESIAWSDDVVVFDSCCTDATADVARRAGARVICRPFDNYGAQREAARRAAGFKYPWLLVLDADERPDGMLVEEISRIATSTGKSFAACAMRRKDHFFGRWIPHCTLYPTWHIRFFRHVEAHYEERAVHEYPVVTGPVYRLPGHILHEPFSKGLDEWRERHVRYARFEAQENLRAFESGHYDIPGLFAFTDPVRRRRSLKLLSMRLPCRPLLRFLYMYVLRMGFLDGRPGLEYCKLMKWYEGMIIKNMKLIMSEK